jgi:lipopolysaccharide biosynthesis glycosyltransferase
VFVDYEKVLYLDADMIANDDVAKLFDEDISGKYAGVVRDVDFIIRAADKEKYQVDSLKELKIDDCMEYFNSGLMLYNLVEVRKKYTVKQMMRVALSKNWKFHDQDTLNFLFKGNVHYLDGKWNVFWDLYKNDKRSLLNTKASSDIYINTTKDLESPSIIHFISRPKPWESMVFNFSNPFTTTWWKYAKSTPFYERLNVDVFSGNILPSSWFVFMEPANKNEGVPFFKIRVVDFIYSSSYAKIDFVFLKSNTSAEADTLFIYVFKQSDSTPGSNLKVLNFDWEKNSSGLKENIAYTIQDDKYLVIWCKGVEAWDGFSFKVQSLESRNPEKPSIEIVNNMFVSTLYRLPEDLKYGTN